MLDFLRFTSDDKSIFFFFNFEEFQNISQLNYSDVKAFVDEHFDLEGQELDM